MSSPPKHDDAITTGDAGGSAPSCGSAWGRFDAEAAAIRAAGIAPRHKPCGFNKAQCTPTQWAAHLEWRAIYYQKNQDIWHCYRNKWLAKRAKVIAEEAKS
jgi:hypothetical protein